MDSENIMIALPAGKAKINVTLFEAQRLLKWGTYGKYGNEPLQWVRLIDCSSEHLLNILKTQPQRPNYYDVTIKSILEDRGVDWIAELLEYEIKQTIERIYGLWMLYKVLYM